MQEQEKNSPVETTGDAPGNAPGHPAPSDQLDEPTATETADGGLEAKLIETEARLAEVQDAFLRAKADVALAAGDIENHGTEALSQFILEHISEMLIMPNFSRLPMRGVSLRYELHSNRLFINDRKLRDWLRKNDYNVRSLLAELAASGILKGAKQKFDMAKGVELPSTMLTVLAFDTSAMQLPSVVADTVRNVLPFDRGRL